MVTNTCDEATPGCHFELRENRSLSVGGQRLFFGFMVMVSGGIAAGFSAIGAWMVFPFAGLEMVALGTTLLWLGRRSREWEAVDVTDDWVRVSRWRGGVARSWRFQRHWVRLGLERPAYRGHPKRLLLASHGRSLEVGGMLTEDEREQLYGLLRVAVRGSDPGGE